MKEFGIYIHIPFCKRKCKYCDFISFPCNKSKIDIYFECVKKEIENIYVQDKIVTTIYIGGGTPSLPDSNYIVDILNTIRKKFIVEKDAEITIEVNPGTVCKEKLLDYRNAGINRISIGVQSTNDNILELIGRIHNYNDFLESYELIKKCEFNNINIDLMLGIPTQTKENLLDSVNKIIKLNPTHISVYSLIVENGTEIAKMLQSKEIEAVDDEIEREMYWSTKELLEKNNYIHYEISNFSKRNYESRHNVNCWNQEEYIGIGLAAHSYVNNKRFSNTNNFDEYVKNIQNNLAQNNITIHEVQSKDDQMREYMMLGFRKIKGIDIREFIRKFNLDPLLYFEEEINILEKQRLVEVNSDFIKLSKIGLDFANLVFEKFV